MSEPSDADKPGTREALVNAAKRVEEPLTTDGGRLESDSTAADQTGVDAQESITRDDPSNAEFHDQVPEDPGH